jgi:hypothetical protein
MAKKQSKNEGFLTAKDKANGLFGNSKTSTKDVLGKLPMGELITAKDKARGLADKKGIDMGKLHTEKDKRGLL